MLKEIIATFLLSGSIGAKSLPVTVPVHTYKESAVVNDTISLYGCFNLRDTFNYYYDDVGGVYTIKFEDFGVNSEPSTISYSCPFAYVNSSYPDKRNYLYQINIDTRILDEITVDMFYYDEWLQDDFLSFTWVDGEELSDLDSSIASMFFYCNSNILLHGVTAHVFDSCFTTYDNTYVVSYTGYYSFLTSLSSIPTKVCVLGNMLFSNTSSFGFTNYGFSSDELAFYKYDLENNVYTLKNYSLPFNKNIVSTTNLMMTSCKMRTATKTYLENVGFFGYVRDTSYDDVTFKDFFFSLVDTPVYFASSLLSFELFGVNLFIALTGLLTLCCILLLIKKFW